MRHVSLLKKHGFSPTDTQRAVSRIAHLEDVTERGDFAVFLHQEHVIAQHRDKWFSTRPDDPRRPFLNLNYAMNQKNISRLVRRNRSLTS